MTFPKAILTVTAATLFAGTAWSQEAAKGLEVELNTLAPSQKGCTFTFVIANRLPQNVSKASYEFVLFNGAGTVERMIKLDFLDLPQGKTKVRRFDLPGTQCDSVKRVLINDSSACEGEGVAAGACMNGLVTRGNAQVSLEG